VKGEINWARKTLKKQDRIVWYLQWIRLALVDEWGSEKVKANEYAKVVKANVASGDPADPSGVPVYCRSFYKRNVQKEIKIPLEHFLSMEIPQIIKYQFVNYVVFDAVNIQFKKFEAEWTEGDETSIPYSKQPLEHHDPMGHSAVDYDGNPIGMSRSGISIIKQFPGDCYWVNLKKSSCRLEGDAMGHCGNTATNGPTETVLSFRKLIKRGKDESQWLWEPHMTFILDKSNGFLGEMKGSNNKKPEEKYHKYIIALLLDPMIKGIRGGGYAPEQNFSLNDLTPEQKEKLFDQKPALMDIKSYFKKMGKTPELIAKINAAWEVLDEMALVWDEKQDHVTIAKFKDIHDFVDDYGNDTAKWMSKRLSGDNDDFVDIDVDEGAIQDVLDILDSNKVEAYLIKEYPDEWEDDDGDSSTLEFIQSNDDELYRELETAARYAYETGASDEMSESFVSSLDSDITVLSDPNEYEIGTAYFDKEHLWDEPVFLHMTFKNILDMVTDEDFEDAGAIRYQVEMSEPYYGFSGYSEETAIEHIKNAYPELV
jgi:hypothetical protein